MAADGDSVKDMPLYGVKDMPLYVRISGHEENYWYVIEEKSSSMKSSLSSANEVIGCKSEKDRVRRLPLPDSGFPTNNLAVLNSRVYLIGGDLYTHTHLDDESLGYRFLDLDLDLGVEEWRTGGGKLTDHQFGGGVAVGHDGCVYSVGPTLYRLHPGVSKWEKLPIPPQGNNPMPKGLLYWVRLLGLTKKKLYVYSVGSGVNDANVMLSFDLESGKWDEDDVLDDNFWGDWSPGVVLYVDRYLFSFGTRSPKLKPIPKEPKSMAKRVQVEVREEEVSGIYVFDLEQRQWLPEPVQGLPSDGTVIPEAYQPLSEAFEFRRFSPQLFQIRKDDDHHLALLWDSVGVSKCKLTWCKFILDACTATADDIPRFSAHSLSPGFCPLDEHTGHMLNCAVGM